MVNKMEIIRALMIPRFYYGMQQVRAMIGKHSMFGGYIDGLLDSVLEGQERFPRRSRFAVAFMMNRG